MSFQKASKNRNFFGEDFRGVYFLRHTTLFFIYCKSEIFRKRIYRNKTTGRYITMADIVLDLQEALVRFTKERVPPELWENMDTRVNIERQLEDDSLSELKDHFWNELLNAVRWNEVRDEIEEMLILHRDQMLEDCSQQSSDEEDDDEEASSPQR